MDTIWMIEYRYENGDYRIDTDLLGDFGFFLSKEEAEKKAEELNAPIKNDYEKQVEWLEAKNAQTISEHAAHQAQDLLLIEAGVTPVIPAPKKPGLRFIPHYEEYRKQYGWYEAIEITRGTV